jgi:anti-sigma regulatory factor (Ser/Thr protein kinase)
MSQRSNNGTRTASTQVQAPAIPREAAVTTYWPPSPPPERLSPASEVTVLEPSRLLSAKFAYTTIGEECLSYRIDSDDTAVGDARHLVTAWLEARSMPALLVADAALATTELVTNALVHGCPPIELRLRLESTDVLIEVRDRATYQPRKLRPDQTDEHGRGLQIVAALASRWGTRPTEHGKAVWCVLSTQG